VEGEELRDFALSVALLLFGAAVGRTAWVPRPIAYLLGLAGLTYLAQDWVAGAYGFTRAHDFAIVLAWVLNLAWMIWLVVVGWRAQHSDLASPGNEGVGRPDGH